MIKKKQSIIMNNNKNIYFYLTLLISISSLAGALGGFFASERFFQKKINELEIFQDNFTSKNKILQDSTQSSLLEEDQSVVKVVQENAPAVVSIVITKDVPKLDSFFNDPFFNQFYSGNQDETETETREIGGGTGFIIDSSGYIITNKHVVDDLKANYTIMLNNQETFEAKILARDNFLDIAILKIEGKDLPIIKLGDSENLQVGQTVIAIGNSLGEFSNTVSKGIISGLKREVEAGNSLGQTEILEEVIQTDAAINPGNSGGPLFDLKGNVIGVNVAMAQGAENIGFTIPINQIKDIYKSVKETGKIVRPYLGVRYLIVNEKIKEKNNLLVDYGALILRGNSRDELAILPGSPADKAGLLEYDIILEIDNEKITEKNNLAKIIRKKEVGEEIELKILSKGKEKITKTTLEESDF